MKRAGITINENFHRINEGIIRSGFFGAVTGDLERFFKLYGRHKLYISNHNIKWDNLLFATYTGVRWTIAGKLRVLIALGANANCTIEGSTPLSVFLKNQITSDVEEIEEILNILIDAGADVNIPDKYYGSILVIACESMPEAIPLLLSKDPDIEGTSNFVHTIGYNVMHAIANTTSFGVKDEHVQALLNAGGNKLLNKRSQSGYTPLGIACIKPRTKLDMIKAFVAAGANVNDVNERHETALNITFSKLGDDYQFATVESTKFLIDAGCDVNAVSNYTGGTPILSAIYEGNIDICKLLLEKGADVNSKNRADETPLIIVCRSSNFRTEYRFTLCKFLLDAGAEVNAQDRQGNTPLHYIARMYWDIDVVEIWDLLIEKGADMTIKNSEGLTPTDIAINESKESGHSLNGTPFAQASVQQGGTRRRSARRVRTRKHRKRRTRYHKKRSYRR